MRRYTDTPYSFINLLVDIAESFLVIRFTFVFLGANASNWLVGFLYGITEPLVLPFRGIFANTLLNGFTFEWSTVIAMIAYMILAAVLVRVISLLVSAASGESEEEIEEERMHHRRHRHA